MHILMAEDDPLTSRILTTELRRLGHSIKTFPDGRSALHSFNLARPDVIISDWVMPGMDGLKFCQAIREIQTPFYPYFILITAKDRPEDIREGMAAGVDDFITKPVSIDQLQLRLIVAERILKQHKTGMPPTNMISMCASCHSVRLPDNRWENIDQYLYTKFDITVSHGICPPCATTLYPHSAHSDSSATGTESRQDS